MPVIDFPISITYQTQNSTPIKDVIMALQATDLLVQDAVSLFPSLLEDVDARLVSISVQRLSQESPLKEIIVAAVFVTAQASLQDGVVAMTKELTGADVPQQYQTLLTVAVLVLLFYGVSLAKDVVSRFVSEGPARRQLNALIADVADKTGKSAEDVTRILDAKYSKPSAVKMLARNAVSFFGPSKREGNAAIEIGDSRIEPQIVDDVPYGDQISDDADFERFKPYAEATLELHATDRDKTNTGWAAVPNGISAKRLKLKLMPPLEPSVLWGKSKVTGDIVVISKATPDGYEPSEIHLTSIIAAE